MEEACDYLKRSAECFFLGNFTEEATLLGVGCQIAVGFTGVDLPFDVRDIIADIINLAGAEEWDWGLVVILLLDLCALLPVIGCLKYVDEAAVLVKHADEAADLVKHADKLKYVDEAGELLTEGRKLADSGIKGLEDAVAEAQKLEKELAGSKLLDDVVGGGRTTQGYSNLADGMDPEDAVRYIINNEKAFFNEFSERASAAGLSDGQIVEAFEAMRNGDYAKMTTYFDTSSPVDGAVFWSGNKEGAAAYATNIGGTIMEQTPGGQVFDNWRGLGGMYPEWDTPTNLAQKPIWDALSSQYANGAEGIVTYVHPDGYVGKV